jgi:hypothetical protein
VSQDPIVAHGSAVPSGAAVANRTGQPNTEPRRAGASPDRLGSGRRSAPWRVAGLGNHQLAEMDGQDSSGEGFLMPSLSAAARSARRSGAASSHKYLLPITAG